eukprot:MONOS_3678.1-p1 / transcript=MONOS_3678.1 / gene=MONOS_3678 / organism=Monocercomonoides_exilis_PA203 / gene_product=unspecified product / transcript_product=unspecified product / location=Mono_scaffold00089:28532-29550(-) / protein_length=275 / sequence_SO=supercontig / SO=protein_coding / is_pseudo=false
MSFKGDTYYYNDDGDTRWTFPGDPEPDPESDISLNDQNSSSSAALNTLETRSAGESGNKKMLSAAGIESNIEKEFVQNLNELYLFPFSKVGNTFIWMAVQFVWAVAMIICGFATTTDRAGEKIPMQMFLVIDGFEQILHTILHYLFFMKPAKYILANPQPVLTSIDQLIPQYVPSYKIERRCMFVGCLLTVVHVLFLVVWTVRGAIILPGRNTLGPTKTGTKFLGGLQFLVELLISVNTVTLSFRFIAAMFVVFLRTYWQNISLLLYGQAPADD